MDRFKQELIAQFTPGEKVIIAMSGGVDSSVSAWAAKEAGCEVVGVTLWLHGENTAYTDAQKVAAQLGIPWVLADYRNFFNQDVISPYVYTYKKGETPNPCSLCNRVGKTKYLFDEMNKAGATKIVSGHYARVAQYNERAVIAKSANMLKDQSYYLGLMDLYHIQFMVYPLSIAIDKDMVRKLAVEIGLPVAPKKDSYEACFLNGEDYRQFLFSKIGEGMQGDFTLHGKRLGNHKGIFNYTVGQRRGLDISHSEPLYVKYINTKTGEIQLSEKPDVFKRGVRLRDCVFYPQEKPIFRGTAKLRHKMPEAECYVELHQDKTALVLFDNPQFAPAPGQVTAIYDGDRIVGGGIVYECF